MTPITYDEAALEVEVMATTLLAVSMELSEAAGVLGVSSELVKLREAIEQLSHAARHAVVEVH
jgi:hypothetical protein